MTNLNKSYSAVNIRPSPVYIGLVNKAICAPSAIELHELLLPAVFTARRNARIGSAVPATAIPSVRPSVRHTPVLCQNDGT